MRLTEPLVRDNGRLRPASWDEALDRAAAGFAATRERDATRSFGMFRCSKATNEMNYAAQKFTRSVMGSKNIDSCNRECLFESPMRAVRTQDFLRGIAMSDFRQ